MTIAVGFVCNDGGIVLAADTKETYDADHTYVRKLETVKEGNVAGAIVGSGESYPVDFIVPKIKRVMLKSCDSMDVFEEELSKLMADVYLSKPIRAYPKSHPSSIQTQFLVAHRCCGENALFLINSSLVVRINNGARVIGYGLMQNMAEELSRYGLGRQEANTAAMFLVYETKRKYNYVGGVTNLYTLWGNGFTDFATTWDQPAREALLNDLRMFYYKFVITVATPSIPPKQFSAIMRSIVRNAGEVRHSFIEIERQHFRWVMRQVGGKKAKFSELPLSIQESIKAAQKEWKNRK